MRDLSISVQNFFVIQVQYCGPEVDVWMVLVIFVGIEIMKPEVKWRVIVLVLLEPVDRFP